MLAVLAGLAIAASGAAAHDLYTNVLKRGEVDERRQLQVSRLAGVGIAVVAIALALGAKDLNVAFLANVAFSIAAATTMPVVVLSIYWKGFNRTGATWGIVGGLALSLVLVVLGPDVMGDDAIWPLSIPAIVTIPFAFALCWLGSRAGRNDPGAQGMPWEEFTVRAFPSRAGGEGDRFRRRRRARDAGADYVVPVTRATSASEVDPARTLSRPSSRSRRMPCAPASSVILSVEPRSMARPRISSVTTISS